MRKEKESNEVELLPFAIGLARRFVQRWDLYARQLADGRYVSIHEPLKPELLFAHLRGEVTLGMYVVSKKNLARFIVFDADDPTGFDRLARLSITIAEEQVPSYLESSRRGGHLWIFFSTAIRGQEARLFGKSVLQKHQVENVELFPKQDDLINGPGSLIRMPFGIHRMTGKRYGFFNLNGSPIAPTLREQIHILSTPQFVPDVALNSYKAYESSEVSSASYNRSSEATDTISDRIKGSMTVLEFISQYVDLKTTKSGAVGQCPFHDDQHPSFSVNNKGNYWHCFAGCGGGSIIDFWSLWRKKQGLDSSFVATVTQLEDMLFTSQVAKDL